MCLDACWGVGLWSDPSFNENPKRSYKGGSVCVETASGDNDAKRHGARQAEGKRPYLCFSNVDETKEEDAFIVGLDVRPLERHEGKDERSKGPDCVVCLADAEASRDCHECRDCIAAVVKQLSEGRRRPCSSCLLSPAEACQHHDCLAEACCDSPP
jgi:hypothetical protein